MMQMRSLAMKSCVASLALKASASESEVSNDRLRVREARSIRMPQEDLAPHILLILVELSEPVHDGLRKSCRIAVVKDNRHIRLLVRMERQVAIDQFLHAVSPSVGFSFVSSMPLPHRGRETRGGCSRTRNR